MFKKIIKKINKNLKTDGLCCWKGRKCWVFVDMLKNVMVPQSRCSFGMTGALWGGLWGGSSVAELLRNDRGL
jgi:hypothetical protein